ncbi:MAG: hypothetical protein M3503_01610 [Actinomycetota bacterium]|nr:hypothetical protein [Actinomycetota bacterium]
MSLDHTTGASDGEHLDEEATSAALDEEATSDELAHLERCATCRASVQRLRVTQAAVAAPIQVDADAREAAVTVALGAFDGGSARPPAAEVDPVRTLGGRRSGGWRRPAPVPWLGIAAVLLLVVLAVPLLRGAGGDPASTRSDTETAGGAAAEDGAESGAESDAAASALPPPVDVGDLGAIDVGEDLRPVVDAALGARPEDEATFEEAEPGGGQGSEEGASDEGIESDDGGAPGGAGDSAPEPSAAPGAGSEGATPRDGRDEDAFQEAQAACEPAVRAALPEAGALVLVGSGTVDGAPALVFGFTGPSERPAVLTALVRREGCELVTFQSYVRG